MGELFENMEYMDIQAERRNTAKQRERADKAEERADKAEQRAEREKERGIQLFIDTCREFGLSEEKILSKLMEKYEISHDMAKKWSEKMNH